MAVAGTGNVRTLQRDFSALDAAPEAGMTYKGRAEKELSLAKMADTNRKRKGELGLSLVWRRMHPRWRSFNKSYSANF